ANSCRACRNRSPGFLRAGDGDFVVAIVIQVADCKRARSKRVILNDQVAVLAKGDISIDGALRFASARDEIDAPDVWPRRSACSTAGSTTVGEYDESGIGEQDVIESVSVYITCHDCLHLWSAGCGCGLCIGHTAEDLNRFSRP